MAVPAFGAKDRTGFVVGLMDWVGDRPPTAQDLIGGRVVEQAKTRFDAIANTGGEVLGERDLAADDLLALDPHDYSVGNVQTVWGWATISVRAEDLLGSR
jgi:hypothetical protein